MAKSNYLKITSDRGEAMYAYLKTPEIYEGDAIGYTIQAKFSQKATEALIAKLEAELERAKGDSQFAGKKFLKEPNMGYREKDNGDIIFKFKTKHEYKKGDEIIKRTVPVFDAAGKHIDVNIGNGSIVKIAFSVIPYWKSAKQNGITLFLDAVQVLDLKEYSGGGNADAFGFGQEEGYVATDKADDNPFEDPVVGEVSPDEEF